MFNDTSIKTNDNPCHGCEAPERHVLPTNCHDTCTKYLEWKKEWDALQESINKNKQLNSLGIPLKPKRIRRK